LPRRNDATWQSKFIGNQISRSNFGCSLLESWWKVWGTGFYYKSFALSLRTVNSNIPKIGNKTRDRTVPVPENKKNGVLYAENGSKCSEWGF
jgi:hypothetical protein